MRVLLLNQYYAPDTAATAQLLADVSKGLVESGHEVHVLCSSRCYDGGALVTDYNASGVIVHRLAATGFGRMGLPGRLLDYFSFYVMAFLKAFMLPRMDVCLSLSTPPFIALVGVALRMVRGSRLVLWSMDMYPEVAAAYGMFTRSSLIYRLLAMLAKRLYASSDSIIALGDVMATKLIEAGAQKEQVIVIDNWVPQEAVQVLEQSKLSQEWGLDVDGQTVVMYSGNLGLGHELDTLLEALGGMEGFHLAFVGRGKLRSSLQERVKEAGWGNVSFHDPQPLARLSESLACADIHIVAQREGTEGLIVPSKIYGILAAARPVIFIGPERSEVANIVISAMAGFVSRPGDVATLSKVLTQLSSDNQKCREMGKNGHDYYSSTFGMERNVNKVVKVVEGI